MILKQLNITENLFAESFHFTQLFPAVLLAIGLSLLLAPLMVMLAKRLGIMDIPGSQPHKRHSNSTPIAGGMIIISAIIISTAIRSAALSVETIGIYAGALLIFAFGLADDYRDLSVPAKLLGQILVVTVLFFSGSQVRMFSSVLLNALFTLLWVVGIINAFNFVDSMDGLALGLCGIAALFFMIVTVESAQPELAVLSATLMGCAAGLYFFNGFPAKLFLGDSGAQLLGFLLAVIGMNYSPEGDLSNLASWYVPILVLGVPIFDMALVVLSRIRHGGNVYKAALDHTYHRLSYLGIESTRAIYLMQLTGFGLGLLAFSVLSVSYLVGNIFFGMILLAALLLIGVLEYLYADKTGRV